MKKYISLFFLLFFVPISLIFSQKKLGKAQVRQIDSIFVGWNDGNQPGAAVGIVKNGELIFSRGYGMASLAHQVPFTPQTVADIGSVAKQITAFSIALLADEGKLSLDDEIHHFFPQLPDYGHPITVRHLIHHTSGLREIYSSLVLRGWTGGDGIRQEDVMHLLKQQCELNFEPGDQYLYCNTAYGLLAEIIQKVSGQSYETFLEERIFHPLGMEHTYVMDKQGEFFPKGADSYRPDDEGFIEIYDNSTMVGQGGIYSCVEDMAKWLANFQHPKVGSPAVMEQILQRGILNNGDTLNYAFGLNNQQYRGLHLIQHSGSSAGFRSWMSWFPEQELGIIVQSNRADAGRTGAMPKITETLLGDVLEPASEQEDQESEEKEKLVLEYDKKELKKFAGSFYSPELETVYTIWMDNQENALKMRMFRNDPVVLSPTPDRDIFTAAGMEVSFERDDSGRLIALRVSNGRVQGMKFFRAYLPSY